MYSIVYVYFYICMYVCMYAEKWQYRWLSKKVAVLCKKKSVENTQLKIESITHDPTNWHGGMYGHRKCFGNWSNNVQMGFSQKIKDRPICIHLQFYTNFRERQIKSISISKVVVGNQKTQILQLSRKSKFLFSHTASGNILISESNGERQKIDFQTTRAVIKRWMGG
jgi:hypothetical protein